jgi:hypothetical protein
VSTEQGFSITAPKIDPFRPARVGRKPDGTPDDEDRVEIGPSDLAFAQRSALGLTPPNLGRMRQEHLQCICRQLQTRDYGGMVHGVGLCDEFPAIYYPEDFVEGAFDYVFEPGMTLCVEVYIGEVGGKNGVKLEDQVLITETGVENLTRCPFDERLMAWLMSEQEIHPWQA